MVSCNLGGGHICVGHKFTKFAARIFFLLIWFFQRPEWLNNLLWFFENFIWQHCNDYPVDCHHCLDTERLPQRRLRTIDFPPLTSFHSSSEVNRFHFGILLRYFYAILEC